MLKQILPTVLDIKCSSIYQEERSVAKAVAEEVIGMQKVGAWDFIMPPVFFINYFKNRRKKEGFILNLLFTKKLALEAAREMAGNGLSREFALQKAAVATAGILAADSKGVYAEKVRSRQLREIELLADHYYSLIMTDHKSYEGMLRAAVKDRTSYLEFMRQLQYAEKEVNHAALQTVGRNDSASNFVSRMEKALEGIRRMDADKYFPAEKN